NSESDGNADWHRLTESRTDERVRSQSIVHARCSSRDERLLNKIAVIEKTRRMLVLAAVRTVLPHQRDHAAILIVEPALFVRDIPQSPGAYVEVGPFGSGHLRRPGLRLACHLLRNLGAQDR